jgi:tyrosyl-tRNA synthetase
MSLSNELTWRGLVGQTTFKDLKVLDKPGLKFYLGVDPSADSMTVGNLVPIILAKHLADYGHHAYLLVGGATGLVGDPDGKSQERDLISRDQLNANKKKITAQFDQLMGHTKFTLVDNYDWFKNYDYLSFLRDVGKHVPLRQMLAREFVESRLKTTGISYAEFSYSLIQAYDYLWLSDNHGVNVQISGVDQWGNCIAGVDLIRRKSNKSVDVLAVPLVVNKTTGVKFGKTEGGAIWLDAEKTSPTSFYQFWINLDDDSAVDFLKIYTFLSENEIKDIVKKHGANPKERLAQSTLAEEVTSFVHGAKLMKQAKEVTNYLTLKKPISDIDKKSLKALKGEIPVSHVTATISGALVNANLASSKGEARKLIDANAISINGQTVSRYEFNDSDFANGRLILKKGKAFKDSALIEQ